MQARARCPVKCSCERSLHSSRPLLQLWLAGCGSSGGSGLRKMRKECSECGQTRRNVRTRVLSMGAPKTRWSRRARPLCAW